MVSEFEVYSCMWIPFADYRSSVSRFL